jgi:ASCH domain
VLRRGAQPVNQAAAWIGAAGVVGLSGGAPRGAASSYRLGVQFSPDLRADVLAGSVTLSYRLWTRPKVKVGGRYAVGPGAIEVDDIELVPFSTVTAADARRCGEPDLESLRRRTAHAGPVNDDTLVYRIEFHLCPDP